ncbi:MAG: hypothetical protein FWF49_02670 [Oscillospiraceae bacterium]|nr:hypothetical protein [Oscillospiraceae bacterium]
MEPQIPQLKEIEEYLRHMAFKKKAFGGCDTEDVLDHFSAITQKYEALISALMLQYGQYPQQVTALQAALAAQEQTSAQQVAALQAQIAGQQQAAQQVMALQAQMEEQKQMAARQIDGLRAALDGQKPDKPQPDEAVLRALWTRCEQQAQLLVAVQASLEQKKQADAAMADRQRQMTEQYEGVIAKLEVRCEQGAQQREALLAERERFLGQMAALQAELEQKQQEELRLDVWYRELRDCVERLDASALRQTDFPLTASAPISSPVSVPAADNCIIDDRVIDDRVIDDRAIDDCAADNLAAGRDGLPSDTTSPSKSSQPAEGAFPSAPALEQVEKAVENEGKWMEVLQRKMDELTANERERDYQQRQLDEMFARREAE